MLKPLFREEFNINGTWWFQEHPNLKFVGVLTYLASEKIELDISKVISDNRTLSDLFLQNISTIFGITNEGEDITLLGCFSLRTQIKVSGIYTSKISANHMLIGMHLEDAAETIFSKFSITSPEIISFIRDRGVLAKRSKNKNEIFNKNPVSYKKPSIQKFNIDNIEAGLEIEVVPTFDFSIDKTFIKEVPVARFNFEVPISFSTLINHAVNFEKLICFLVNIYSGPPEITGFILNETNDLTRVKFYFLNPWYKKAEKTFSRFSYSHSKNIFSEILSNWFLLMDEHPGIFGTFLYGKIQKRGAFETVHLYVNTLEAYYDLKIDSPLIPKKKFKTIYKKFLSVLPDDLKIEDRNILVSKLNFLNSNSLAKKLKEIFSHFSFINSEITNYAKKHSNKMVEIRHFQSHGKLGKQQITEPRNLVTFYYLLEMFSIACLLEILGYNKAQISSYCESLDFYFSLDRRVRSNNN